MMRSFAIVSSTAVALVALPASAGAQAAVTTGDATSLAFLEQPVLGSMTAGVALWLGVGIAAFLIALLALGRSSRAKVVTPMGNSSLSSPRAVLRELVLVDAGTGAR